MKLQPWARPLQATLRLPGDKSITHRGFLFAALAKGDTEVEGWLDAADTRSSLGLTQALGVKVRPLGPQRMVLQSPGPEGWREPECPIDCGNSGTTMRLGMGLGASRPGLVVLYGDPSLSRRPMQRVAQPLAQLGADIAMRHEGLAPIAIQGKPLTGGRVTLEVASAQVKSAVLLAGLQAQNPVTVVEPVPTRDHSERLLRAMGARIDAQIPGTVRIEPSKLQPLMLQVPGDPSSGAFWATLAALLAGSQLTLQGVSLNPGRLGFYQALQQMGASVVFHQQEAEPEPWGDIVVGSGRLTPIRLGREQIPSLIDELPLLALLATQAQGISTITGAEELRVKESDRIVSTCAGLEAMGAQIEPLTDGFRIAGPTPLRGATVRAYEDHRIAMMLAMAAAVAEGPCEVEGMEAVAISYPTFMQQYQEFRG